MQGNGGDVVDIFQDVRSWLHSQRNWLQQAADLLLAKGSLDDGDIEAISNYLKSNEGQSVTNSRAFNELGAGGVHTGEVRLRSISDVVGIENLGPGTPLSFGDGNLCVIYGNNGSGKSGYTRLLKKAAGKPGAKDLKPNVFKAAPIKQTCSISFNDGTDKEIEWDVGSGPIEAIRAVDIFDTDTANNYLTKDNEATYTPPVVSLFDRLSVVASAVKGRLQVEQSALMKALPVIPQQYLTTRAGAQFNGLRVNSAAVEIDKLKAWTDVDQQALERLNERLSVADPSALAKQKRARKTQVEQIATQIKNAADAYSDKAIEVIRSRRQDALATRNVAKEAAQIASAKLDGIGSDTWKAMWEAARAYSQRPYPSGDFPVVDDARCLLCHQELADDAKRRLEDFEKFVQGDVEQAAVKAEAAYRMALDLVPAALPAEAVADLCNAAGLIDDEIVGGVKRFWQQVAASGASIRGGEASGAAAAVAVPQDIIEALEGIASALEEESKQHDQDAAGFNRIEASQQKLELEANQWTSQQSAAIDAEMQRLKTVSEYDGWIKLTSTQHITQKGGLVAEAAITDAYVARFNKELKALRASKVKVKLAKTRAEKGKTYHGLQLEGAVDGGAKPEQVLSEGERRIISLAAFLADVADKPHASTFIFDDPISSLDQDFESAVANRLVQLAHSRQVLVFTHRLSLYGALEDVARKMGQIEKGKEWKDKHLEQRCIETFSSVSGLPVSQPIWASKTEAANNTLVARLEAAKKAGDAHGSEAYKALAQGICSDFRKLLERSVESDLLNEVVVRHRRSVTTDGRLPKLSNINPDDCQLIDRLMTKYSAFEHSQSNESPVEVPEAADLRQDLDALREWRESFKKRPAVGVVVN